jgi:DDE domain
MSNIHRRAALRVIAVDELFGTHRVDETYVKVSGRWRYVYRAIDQFGQVIDVSGGRRGSHPPAPTDPGVTVSRYPALVILVIRQWGAC